MPFECRPYWKEFEKVVDNYRLKKMMDIEFESTYQLSWYSQFYHPQRELNDSIIFDAEYFQDIQKRLNEQRHELAIHCVNLGIFKDVYEAKESRRQKSIHNSLYKYKHMLYRE
jgi:hypothetical protein